MSDQNSNIVSLRVVEPVRAATAEEVLERAKAVGFHTVVVFGHLENGNVALISNLMCEAEQLWVLEHAKNHIMFEPNTSAPGSAG